MTPVAAQALAKARTQCPPSRRVTPSRPAATPAVITVTSPPPAQPYNGPIDKHQVMQGRQCAIGFIQSCPAQLLATWSINDLLQRMERSLANKPPSFAMGFNEVLNQLREHLANMRVTSPPL